MEVRSLGRVAIDRWLRVARMPFDAVVHILPEGRGPRNITLLAIDRLDASVRAAAGGLLHDDALRDEATRRRAAVDQRQRAITLRARADEEKRQADDLLAVNLERSAQLRQANEREAEQERQAIASTAEKREQQVERAANAKALATDEALEERLAANELSSKRERLKVLDEQAAALDQQHDALTASDEAQRLGKATRDVKAARKGTA